MKRIFKYMVPAGSWAAHLVPAGTRVVGAEEQHGAIVVYAEVDPNKRADRQLRVHTILTGDIVPPGAHYLKTLMTQGGSFVVHVYIEQE